MTLPLLFIVHAVALRVLDDMGTAERVWQEVFLQTVGEILEPPILIVAT